MSSCPVCRFLVRLAALTLRVAALTASDVKLRRAVTSCAEYVGALAQAGT